MCLKIGGDKVSLTEYNELPYVQIWYGKGKQAPGLRLVTPFEVDGDLDIEEWPGLETQRPRVMHAPKPGISKIANNLKYFGGQIRREWVRFGLIYVGLLFYVLFGWVQK